MITPCIVTRAVDTLRLGRYLVAIEGQGVGFTELRTSPRELRANGVRDSRGFVVLPPAELFGEARPRTAEVLSGVAVTTWGWPS